MPARKTKNSKTALWSLPLKWPVPKRSRPGPGLWSLAKVLEPTYLVKEIKADLEKALKSYRLGMH